MIKPNRIFSQTVLWLAFLFLYLPLLVVIVYSFNESKLANVWSGFSFKWYGALLNDDELVDAAWFSFKIAVATAFAAVIIGTWSAMILARYGRFFGFTHFMAMLNAPIVLPEVILGISLLLLFVNMQQLLGWPEDRGFFTIWIGHTISCIAYVAITVQSRLSEMDKSLIEAAHDLGAPPLKAFFDITLPLISQALISGWLLSFTISIDNVVLSAFLSGPGSSTLPLVVFSRTRLGLNPEINALGTLFIFAVTIGIIISSVMTRKREKQHAKEMQLALNPH
ncbi:MAG: ABC transporter permease subunit [Methylophilaceae bacterium]